jgi:nitrite reductase (NADH) large subunit
LLTREPCAPYYRLSLTRYLAGEIDAPRLIAHSPAWWAQHNIDLVLETDLLEVDRSKRELRTSRGTIAYDRLVAATGARSFLPPLSNAMVHGVTPLRSLVDARFVLRHASADTHVVVVGGGVLGLETAYGLSRKGCQVTVCEGAKQLLPRQLDAPSAAIFQKHLESKGIGFVLGDMPSEVVGDEIARGLKLASGAQLEAEVIIVSAGVRPNSLVWRNSGLRVDRGLFVDDAMQTSDSQIFAAGDLVEHKSVLYGIWPAAMEMGRVAGCNAAGGSESFPGLPMSHSLKVVDLDVFSIGSSRPESATMSEITRPVDPPNYAKLVVDRGIVVGAVLMGDTTLSAKLKTWVTERRDVSSILAANNSPEAIFSQLERG